jgi:hypothetical protein
MARELTIDDVTPPKAELHGLITFPERLPPLPEKCKDVWKRLDAEMKPTRTKLGVRYLLAGWSYRNATEAAGLANHSQLREFVRRHRLGEFVHSTTAAIRNHHAIEIAATEALLEKDLTKESGRDLAVIAGVSRDKIRDYEQRQAAPTTAIDALHKVAEAIAATGMKLEVTLEPADTQQAPDPTPVIDVESVPTE